MDLVERPEGRDLDVLAVGELELPLALERGIDALPPAWKEIEVLVNGQAAKPLGKGEEISSGSKGAFSVEFQLPPGTLPAAKVEVKAQKPNWQPQKPTPVKVVAAGVDDQGNQRFEAAQNFPLTRAVTPAFWIAASECFTDFPAKTWACLLSPSIDSLTP